MGVGLILFWPTLFFREGGDGPEAAEYARGQSATEGMRRKESVHSRESA